MKRCINTWWERRTTTQQHWLWFILLWCGGLCSVLMLGKLIKWGMGI